MRPSFVGFFVLFALVSGPAVLLGQTGTALVRHAPTLNGTVEGSVHQMLGESVNLNGGAVVTDDLLVPGTPTVRLNGNPGYAGTLEGSGAAAPGNFQITLNGSASLRNVIRRTNPVALPAVGAPASPTGTTSVTINSPGQAVNWSSLRHLILNGGVGQYAVPAGSYGDFTANGGSGFTLGAAGSTQPTVYHFQRLTLNGNTQFRVVGPVVVNVANGFNANGPMGSAGNPSWLTLNIQNGGLTLNGGVVFHGFVLAPTGTVVVNGNSQLIGGVTSDRLTVNGNGVLRLQNAQAPNQPPSVSITAPANGASFTAPASFDLTVTGTDSDGAVAKVEFFQGTTKLGEDSAAPFSLAVSGLGAGSYNFMARATDNAGAAVESATVVITVDTPNQPPMVALSAPMGGEVFTAPASISLTAAAIDADGTVSKVEFYQDGTKIGEVAAMPYTLTTSGLPAGTYAFLATASDNQGASTTSAPVTVTVIYPNQSPTVSITAPADGASFDDPGTFDVVADAADPDGLVTMVGLYQDGVKVSEDTQPPYEFSVSGLAIGTYDFVARATDNAGSATDSAPVRITVAHVNDAPVAEAQTLSVVEDGSLALVLTAQDPDGDALQYEIVDGPGSGALSGIAPNLTYTPAANFSGTDSFTFKASDGQLESAPATISITVHPINDPPVAVPAEYTLPEDTPQAITLVGLDPDSGTLQYVITTPPSHGTLSGTAPALTYTPAPGYHGPDSFVFTVFDGEFVSAPATISLSVTPQNDVPVALSFAASVLEGETVNLTLAATDADNNPLTFTVLTLPVHGTLSGTAPALVYHPENNFDGIDTFTYQASDGLADSAPATVTIDVTDGNLAPEADAQAVTVTEDTPTAITLTGTDPGGDPLEYFIVTSPAHGSLSGTAPNLTYTPNGNFDEDDSFTFWVSDGVLDSEPATVSITVTPVNDAPIALPDEIEAVEDTSVEFELLAGDSDGDSLTYTIVTPPTHGTLVGSLDGPTPLLLYVPAENFNGTDTLIFKVSDGTLESAPAEIRFVVAPVNDAPVGADALVSLLEDVPVAFTLGGLDVDGDLLTFTLTGMPANGTLSGSLPDLVYTPAANFFGNDALGYTVSDGQIVSGPYVVTLAVEPVNDAPVAVPQSAVTPEDGSLAVVLVGTDIENDPLTYTVTVPPAHGTLTGTEASLTYGPAANYFGPDRFSFVVSDGELVSAPADFELTVTPVNDPPVALADAVITAEDTALAIELQGTDVDGDLLAYVISTPPSHGTLTAGATPSAFTFTPDLNYHGPDTFAFTVSDLEYTSAPAEIAVEITPVNDAPVAATQAVETDEDVTLSVVLTGSDVDGDALTFTVLTQPAHGTLSGTTPDLVYTPAVNYHGTDFFTFAAHDGQVASEPATVSLTIHSVNDAPVATSQAADTPEDTALAIVLAGSDVDGDALTFIVTTPPAHGTLSGTAPHLTYTPAPDFNGNDAFEFTVSDGSLVSPAASVAITVTPVNDPPVAASQSVMASGGEPLAINLTATDVDGDDLQFVVLTSPAHGTLTGSGAALTYVPGALFAGEDSFTFAATDGTAQSVPATVTISVTAPVNQPPVVQAGPDANASYGPATGIKPYSNIILNHDEWTLTQEGFAASPYAGQFARNIASWFTGGRPGRFLAYTNTVPGSVDFAYTGAALRTAMESAGHTWVTSSTIPFTLENLREYDAVFLCANQVDNQVLIDYVNSGGSVHISAGTKWSGSDAHIEASWYNTFLNVFGLAYGFPYNGVGGTLPVDSDHPIFDGISTLYYGNGNPVIILDPDNPRTVVINRYQGKNLLALYTRSSLAGIYTLQGAATDDGLPSGELTYQWTVEDAPDVVFLDDPTAPNTAATFAAPGVYTLRLTVSDGELSSSDTVVINVEFNEPPQVYAGGNVGVPSAQSDFTPQSTATDDGIPRDASLTFSWRKVSGPTEPSFSDPSALRPTITFPADGLYVLELTANDGQFVTTSLTEVRVGLVNSVEPPAGLAAWWPGNGHPREILHGNAPLRLLDEAGYADGRVAQGFDFDGAYARGVVLANPDHDIGASPAGLTIEMWARPGRSQDVPLVVWATDTTEGTSLRQWGGTSLYAFLTDTAGGSHIFFADGVFAANTWVHVALTYDKATGWARLYRNGVIIREQNLGVFTPRTTYDLQVGSLLRENRYYQGQLDEISLYTRPLTAGEIAGIFQAGVNGKVPPSDNLPPVVAAGPDVVLPGIASTATLTGVASDDNKPFGAPTITWSQVDGPFGGTATFANPSSAATTATFDVPGTYLLKLTATDGFTAAVSDLMEVRVGLAALEPTAGLAAWWPANGHPQEIVRGNHDVELFHGMDYAAGRVSQAFSLDGVNDHGRIVGHSDLDIGASAAGLTIELWARPGRNQDAPLVVWATNTTEGVSLRQWGSTSLYAFLTDTSGGAHIFFADGVFAANTWVHVALTYDRTTGWARLYRNGVIVREQNLGLFTPRTTYDLQVGSLLRENRYFQGQLDEIGLYTRPLTATEIAAIYHAGADGKTPPDDNLPPVVAAGLDAVLAGTGATAILAGTVTDDGKPFGSPSITWSQVDGPVGGTATFADPSAAATTATFSAPGTYLLKLTGTDRYTVPVSDLMEVRVGLAALEPPAGLAAWWPANGHPQEIVRGNHDVELFHGMGYAAGRVSQAFSLDGINDHGRIVGHSDLDIGASAAGLTIELWARPSRSQDVPLVAWATTTTEGVSLRQWGGLSMYAFLTDTSGGAHIFFADGVFAANTWVHVALTYDRTTGWARLYRNGILAKEQNLGLFTPRTTYDLQVGSLLRENRYFQGQLDEISLYTRPLTAAEIAAIYHAGADGKTPPDDNLPPVVSAGPDVTLPDIGSVATLAGTVSDDNQPFGAPIITWSQVDGPVGGSATFGNPAMATTTATFDLPGTYLLRLTATDGYSAPVSDLVEVRVGVATLETPDDLAAWWPGNGHPREVVNGNHDVELFHGMGYAAGRVSQAFSLDGTNDHGRIVGHADLDIGASAAGLTIELWARPGRSQDVPLVVWGTNTTEGVSLRQWGGTAMYAFLTDTAGVGHTFFANSVFAANTWVHVAVTYDKSSGLGRLFRNGVMVREQNLGIFTPRTTYDLQVGSLVRESRYFQGLLDEISFYGRPLSPAEITAIYNAGANGKALPAANVPPTVTLDAPAAGSAMLVHEPVTLTATAADADGTVAQVEFFDGTTSLGVVATPSTPPTTFSFTLPAGFSLPGARTLSAVATDDDGESTTSAPLTINVVTALPVVTLTSPADGSNVVADVPLSITAQATVAGDTIAKVEFFDGSTKLGERTAPDAGAPSTFTFTHAAGFTPGPHSLTARATSTAGAAATSAAIGVTAVTYSGAPVVELITPAEDARISAPVPVTGVVAVPALTGWVLEYRLKVADGAPVEAWTQFAAGSNLVGNPGSQTPDPEPQTPGELGTFDPTLLLNGIYELRLGATETGGSTLVSGPITVVVEGNMKVGAFSLAFEDLKVPVAGIPITLTRTYDSRDQRVGDFGPGWHLAVANVRVQKNRNLGANWYQTLQSGSGIQFYYVDPLSQPVVTVTMPDGESHRFRGGAYVKVREGDPDNASFAVVADDGLFKFYPLGDTTSTLEPINAAGQLDDHFYIHGTGDQDLRTDDESDPFAPTYNPTRFRLTTSDGTRYIIDEKLGLLRLEDLNGNTLVLNRDAQNRVTSMVSTQTPDAAPQTPIVTTVTIHRDATGKVDYIEDPAGQSLDYLYDAQGRLESFSDREMNTTQFKYLNPSFPHYLTDIVDPRGITALRTEFDEAGRMVKQIDADGEETVFARGIDANGRFEQVTDRLGHETTFYYDARGNVTSKIDPLGGVTSYTYYPDTDRVKFEVDHYGNVKSMAYDARGNVIIQTMGASLTEDPATPTVGYTTRTTYNALSAPTQITDPDGRVQTFGYDPTTNNLLSHTVGFGGPAPATTTYAYNTDGTLDTITDALGNVTSHAYNYSFSDAAYPGAVKQITVTVTDPAGTTGSDPANASATVLRVTKTVYDAQENMLAQVATRTLPQGGTEDVVTRYLYDSENRLVATVMPDGKVSETRYTSFGQTDKTVLWKSLADYQSANDALARVTSYGYDNRGNQVSTTHPDGASESSGFDLEGRREWAQDANGNRTHFVYDAVGRLTHTYVPDATPAIPTDGPYTETVYDLAGRVTDTYDELRRRTTVAYFPDGTPDAGRRKESIQVLSTGNLVTSYQYDQAGNVRFVTDPRGNTVETRYDEHGRPTTVVYPATDEHPATESTTAYNVLGQRIATTDQEGKITRYRYDGLGRLVEVRQYLDQSLAASDAEFSLPTTHSSLVATRYSFDERGNQTSQTDARGNATTYQYDSLGRRTKRLLPDNATETLQYDEWGNLWKRTDFKGHTTTFLYDVRNRLTEKQTDPAHPSLIYSHAPDKITYGYDAAGNRTDATVEKGSTVLYAENTPADERNRRLHKDTALGRLTYGYHDNGLLESISSSNSDGVKLGYRYDEANRLAFVDDTTGGAPARTTAYGYNANGSLATVTLPNTVVHTYGYDALNRLRTLNVAKGVASLHSYEYKLRASGHRQQVIENGTRTSTFGYDSLYRLTSETLTGDTRGNNGSVGYGLDKVGNRESRTSSVPAVSTAAHTFNSRDWLNTDVYDANGNTLTSSFSSVSVPDVYDFEDRLIIRYKPDGSTVNLSYDADGILRQKAVFNFSATLVSATGYMTDALNPTGYAQVLEERVNLASGTTVKVYAYGSDLISQSTLAPGASVPVFRYYAYDGLMSVRELTDANGLVTDSYDYDAFGIRIYGVGSTVNDYLYRGERFDSDIGQYSLRARFYNQATGRFWNQDTYEGSTSDPMSLHKYLYAHGNPLTGLDPSGHFTLTEIQTVMGNMMTLARMAQPVIRAYHYANSISDMVNMAKGLAHLLQTGSLDQVFREAMAEVGSIMSGRGVSFSAEDAAEAFVRNAQTAMPYAFTHWAPLLLADMAAGTQMTGYTLFLPNFRGKGNKATRTLPAGVKIGGKPVQFVLGGVGSGRLAGIGIQTKNGSTVRNRLFYRMDIHSPSPFHGNPAGTGMKAKNEEHAVWEDAPFHFHVMKYEHSF